MSSLAFMLGMLLLFVGQTHANETPKTKLSKVKAPEYSRLLLELDAIQERHDIPAYAVVVSGPEETYLSEIRALNEKGEHLSLPETTYFRVGSITKTFVGLAALKLEQTGKIDLSHPLTKYLKHPRPENSYADSAPITIIQLLEHSAGLTDMSWSEFEYSEPVPLSRGLEKFSSRHRTRWQPGEFHSYSNTGYGYVGRVLEIAGNQEIDNLLQEQVFKPLKMPSATLDLTPEVENQLIDGFKRGGEKLPYWHMVYSSLGAMNVYPADMAKLLQLYLNGGSEEFSPRLINKQLNPASTLAARNGLSYGYGAGIYSWYRNGYQFYGHGGNADGYLSAFGIQKDAESGYFVVINSKNNRAKRAMKRAIESFLVDELPRPDYLPEKPFPFSQEVAGSYRQTTSRFGRFSSDRNLQLRIQNGVLQVKESRNDWFDLIHIGDGLFRYRDDPGPTISISRQGQSFYFVGDEGNFVKSLPANSSIQKNTGSTLPH